MQKGGGIASLLENYLPKRNTGIKTLGIKTPAPVRKRGKRAASVIRSMIQKIKKTVKRGGTLFTRHKKRIPHRVINPGLDRWYRSYQKKKGEPVTGLTGYNYY